jgi:uncharacterized protein (TIGR03790 family)
MRTVCLVAVVVSILRAGTALAGGGPVNVVVLYNGDDADAADVAAYYAAARDLPDGHLCAVSGIDPTTRDIAFEDYWALVHEPLVACLEALPQPEDVDYLVVVRGLPYRVVLPDDGFYTSLQAMLQIHEAGHWVSGDPLAGEPQEHVTYHQPSVANPSFAEGTCQAGDLTIENDYSGWYSSGCGIVRTAEHPPAHRRVHAGGAGQWEFADNLFAVGRLDGFDFDDARDLVDRALAADGTFPDAEILCMEGADSARAARDPECEFVVRYLEQAGFPGSWLSPHDTALEGHEVSAYFTGASDLRGSIDGVDYVPGALACNLTSTGAAPSNFFCNEDGTECPSSESQTSIARFVRAGATGAHGAVAEPLNNCFPNAGTLMFYAFGYSMGEAVLFNQRYLYWQNLLLGDPLTTPWAERPVVWFVDEVVPQGSELVVEADHPDGIARIRLYVEDVLVAEAEGETLAWTVEEEVGSAWRLMAVAEAANVLAHLDGWPEDEQLPQPDVQGWVTGELSVDEPLPEGDDDDSAGPGDDDDTGGDAADDDEPDGCGCNGSGSRPGIGALLALLVSMGLRRRGVGSDRARQGHART